MSVFLYDALVAFLAVLLVLATLAALLFFLRWLGARRQADRNEAGQLPAAFDPQLVAVLAAAAHAALGARVELHRIHLHREPAAEGWSRAGRMDIMLSHKLERKR